MRMPYFVKGMLFVGAMCVIGCVEAKGPTNDDLSELVFELVISKDQLTMCLDGEFDQLGMRYSSIDCYEEFQEQMDLLIEKYNKIAK